MNHMVKMILSNPISRIRIWLRANIVRSCLLLACCGVSSGVCNAQDFSQQFEILKRDPHALYAFLKKMPKGGELHSHLSGAVPFERLLAVAITHNYKVVFRKDDGYVCGFTGPGPNREWNEPCRSANIVIRRVADLSPEERNRLSKAVTLDLSDRERGEDSGFAAFDRIFDRLSALTDNAEIMPELVQEVMEEAASNNVSYLELKVNPIGRQDLQGKAVPIEELVSRLKDAVAEKNRHLGPRHAVVVKFIVTLRRQTPNDPGGFTELRPVACSLQSRCPSRLRQAYFLAARRYSDIIVGVDLAGLPEVDSTADFPALKREFDDASITLHAGETLDATRQNHIQEAILAGAKRIGHGFNLQNSVAATALVCAREIPLEISLTSNKLLGLLPGDDLKAHPFSKYFRAEICGEKRRQEIGHLPVTLNTDDAGIFQTDLTNEFFLAVTTFDLNWDEVKQLSRNSIEQAFANEAERICLLGRWEQGILTLENDSSESAFLKKLGNFLIWLGTDSVFKSILGVFPLALLWAGFYWCYLAFLDKRFISIAPFRVWGPGSKSFPPEAVASLLEDELMKLRSGIEAARAEQVGPSGLPSQTPPRRLEVRLRDHVNVQIQGMSLRVFNEFLRRLYGRQILITGDVIPRGRGLFVVAQSDSSGRWEASSKTSTVPALHAALVELAEDAIISLL